MAIKLKIPTVRGAASAEAAGKGLSFSRTDRALCLARVPWRIAVVVGFFAYWYVKYDRIIEQRFRGPVFASSAKIFAAPQVVRVGSS